MKKLIYKTANLVADILEEVARHLSGAKRSRRRYTARKRTYARRQKTPVLIIKVVME